MWKHRLSNTSPDTLVGDCAACGPGVQLRRKSRGRLACRKGEAKWNAKTPDRARRNDLKRKYNMTPADVEVMLNRQGGRCFLCRTNKPGGRGTWHVDHDHQTGDVRSLLCHGCNTGIGMLKDSPSLCAAAALYLSSRTFQPGISEGLL